MRTEDTKAILKNSSMLMIFNITSMDRQDVSEIVNLSESQIKYVKNPVPGRGLLCWEEKTVIELDAIYPEDCSLFEVIKSSNSNKNVSA